jgi:drug/metabolite transporter (DMT)-like permease
LIEKWKVFAVVLVATLAVASGEAMLSKGMKLSSASGSGILAQIRGVLNVHVICGTLLMALYFGLYMLALKWADFSFVLPLTALSFIFGAVLARYYLHENVSPSRWIGTLVIMAGVVIVGLGESGKP